MTVEEYKSFESRLKSLEEGELAIIPECISITERQRSRGNPPDITESLNSFAKYNVDELYSNYAIVHRICLNSRGNHEKTDLEIHCPVIQAVVREVIGKHSDPGILIDPIVFPEPYYTLFQFRQELIEHAGLNSHPLGKRERLTPLMDFVKDPRNSRELQNVQEQQVLKGLIQFKHIQLLFRASDIIVGLDKGVRRCWLVQYTHVNDEDSENHEHSDESSDDTGGGIKKSEKYMEIHALSWDFDGERFGPFITKLKLHSFAGLMEIRRLKYFPIKYWPDIEKVDLIDQLISRGRKWCELVDVRMWNYKGIAQMVTKRDWSHKVDVVPAHISGEIVLDYRMFKDVYPKFSVKLEEYWLDDYHSPGTQERGVIHWANSSKVSTAQRRFVCGKIRGIVDFQDKFVPDNLQALLSPGVIPGYSLSEKFWGYFRIDVATLEPIEWKDDPTRDLHIDSKHRRIIGDLIKHHRSQQGSVEDIVAEKGTGLIILLYGSPGCGKTLTAELFAKQEKCPLYSVSANDLNNTPVGQEAKLQTIFNIAQFWKAILLIDEADILLGKRSSTKDFFGRSMTSLFLRRLEYFKGIMFLTTNRRDDIDEAFESRSAIILHYPSLGIDHRAKIWEMHLKGTRISPEWDLAEKCQEFAKRYELNGRDIRHLVQVSMRICQQRSQPLSDDMIEEVFKLRHRQQEDIS